ncbi:MAG: glycosyltransferase family 4 protein [Microbacteriaceae bacterium]|nr:glycosyltransferase family 4 protein [Microbacteriaceae bacterium]
MPEVLVDATAIPAARGGVGRYVDEIVRFVAAGGTPVAVACQARDAEHFRALGAEVHAVAGIERTFRRMLWEQFGLPRLARRAGARLIHSPHYTVPVLTRRRRVVAFWDATFFSDPHLHTRVKRRFFPAWMRLSRRLADQVVTSSSATARELDRFLKPIPGRDYRVVHLAADHARFRPPAAADVERVRERLGLDRPWIAFLGTIEPRKNVPALVDAYARISAAWTGTAEELPVLAIAGQDGWDVDLAPHLAAVPAPGRALRLGYVALEDLPAYLGGAELVAYPSLGEGFGLPVVEAMACGAAVLTTRRLSLPEVGGDAVAYAEPDVERLAVAMTALIASPEERAELGRRGIERAAGFTWEATAAATLAVWREVLAR